MQVGERRSTTIVRVLVVVVVGVLWGVVVENEGERGVKEEEEGRNVDGIDSVSADTTDTRVVPSILRSDSNVNDVTRFTLILLLLAVVVDVVVDFVRGATIRIAIVNRITAGA